MIEKIVFDYLNSILSVPAYTEKPEQKPKRYILIEKTGGHQKDHLNYATIALKSYAESKYQAAVLNEELKNAMNNIVILDDIGSSILNSDYEFEDTTKKQYRYQAVYDLVY